MIVPIALEHGEYLCCVDKDHQGAMHVSTLMPVRYVPLTDARLQYPH